jgi:hypothetical protein
LPHCGKPDIIKVEERLVGGFMEFKKYTKQVMVNGHAVQAEVTVEVHEDDPQFILDRDYVDEAERIQFEAKAEGTE